MKFHKIQFNEKCYVVAATDANEKIITAGAFTNQADADSAANILYTLAVKCGLVDAKKTAAPELTLDELLKMMEESK